MKEAEFSIIPPTGWIEFKSGIPSIEKERIKVGAKSYILKWQKNHRYQDTFGFARLQKQPDPQELKNRKKTSDGKYIYYDIMKYNLAKQDYTSFSRIINYDTSWFNISYTTHLEKLVIGKDLSESGIPKKIVDSIRSFKIEKHKKPNKSVSPNG